jgi:hypothetical protein
MITDLAIFILRLIIDTIVLVLPQWSVWPPDLLNGLSYTAQSLAKLNFIFPIDSLFNIISFVILFETLYLTAKIILKVFGFIRGSGSGLDI